MLIGIEASQELTTVFGSGSVPLAKKPSITAVAYPLEYS
jgi:hypothetical protein